MDAPQPVLDRFAAKLEALRQAYCRAPEEFDEGEGFVTGPPLPEEQARRVEQEHQLVLPPEYRTFLRQFGDTATGPGKRFFRLAAGLTPDSGAPFPLAGPFLGCESPAHRRLPEAERWDDSRRLSREWEQIPLGHGVLKLSDYGCAISGVLVLSGPLCGRVWVVSGDAAYYGPFGGSEPLHDEEAGGWEPTETPKEYPFFEWYESWLDGQLKRVRGE